MIANQSKIGCWSVVIQKGTGSNQLCVESQLPVVAIMYNMLWVSFDARCNQRVIFRRFAIDRPGSRSCGDLYPGQVSGAVQSAQVLSIRTSCCSLRLLWIHPVLLAIRVRSIKLVGNNESQTDGGHAGSAHQTGDWRMGKLVSGIVTAGAWGAVSLPSP